MAVILCVPGPSDEVVNPATAWGPIVSGTGEPNGVVPSMNWTVPVGVVPSPDVTVAPSVTDCPGFDGEIDVTTVVVDGALLMTMSAVATLPPRPASTFDVDASIDT